MKRALLIFIKNPVKGKVKTRLARTLGDDKALEIYHFLLRNTRKVALQVDANRLLFYSEYVDEQDDWPAEAFHKLRQNGRDLGERMHQALTFALRDAGYDQAVLIGSDIAGLSSVIIEHAFEQLTDHSFVLGPAQDGGYYLIGMKQPTPSLFGQMPWSTDQVAPETIRRMKALGHPPYLLPVLSDIDREEDLTNLKCEM